MYLPVHCHFCCWLAGGRLSLAGFLILPSTFSLPWGKGHSLFNPIQISISFNVCLCPCPMSVMSCHLIISSSHSHPLLSLSSLNNNKLFAFSVIDQCIFAFFFAFMPFWREEGEKCICVCLSICLYLSLEENKKKMEQSNNSPLCGEKRHLICMWW